MTGDKTRVLDAGAFIDGRNLHGVTCPAVASETEITPITEVIMPNDEHIDKVKNAAQKTGDLDVLSVADIEILALSLQIDGILVTNDFAIQNVAKSLNISVEGAGKKIERKINWIWYCPACGWKRKRKGECERCGTETKRRPR